MRLILWLILAYVGYKILKGLLQNRKKIEPEMPGTETFQDPVCGVYVAADDAVIGRIDNKRLYFCSMNCLDKYREKLTEHHYHHNEEAP